MFNNLKKQLEQETGEKILPNRSNFSISSSGSFPVPATHQLPNKEVFGSGISLDRSINEDKASENLRSKDSRISGGQEIKAGCQPSPKTASLEMSELRSRYRSLEAAYEDYRAKTGDLLSKKDSHIARLQERVSNLESSMKDAIMGEEKLHTVAVERDLFRQKLETLEKAYSEEKSAWESKINALQTKIREQIQQSELQIAEISGLQAKIREQTEQSERQIRELTKKFESKCLSSEKKSSSENSNSSDEDSQLSSLEKSVTAKDTEINLLLAKINAITLERDEYFRKCKELVDIRRRSTEEKTTENLHLRRELGETQEYFEAMDIQSEQHITTLANQVEDLHRDLDDTHRDFTVVTNELEEKDQAIEKLVQRIKTLDANSARQQDVIESLREDVDRQKDRAREAAKEKDELLLRNASLSHEVEIVRRDSGGEREEIRAQLAHLSDEVESYKKKLRDLEGGKETSAILLQLNDKVAELEQSQKDRDTTIRLQQQRLADMKKTLQKELKLTAQSDESAKKISEFSTGSLGKVSTPFFASSNPNLSLADSDDEVSGVNFQYLRHVLLRFVTSTDYEASQLVRAVSTVLRLNQEEEKLVWDTLRWKNSWLPGSKPRLPINSNNAYPRH